VTFLLSVLAWPAMLIAIRVLLLVETGDAYLNYLLTYPLFIFTDILVPVIYVFIWRQRSGAVKGTGSRSIERTQQQQPEALYAE
jgi:predicted membrane protein